MGKVLDAHRNQNLAGGLRIGDEVKIMELTESMRQQELKEEHIGKDGIVVGAPEKNRNFKVLCDFAKVKNVSIDIAYIEKRYFPNHLGPFELLSAGLWRDEGDVEFKKEDSNGMPQIEWKMKFDSLRKQVQTHIIETPPQDIITGYFSPISEITVDPHTKREMDLPREADLFMFSYPVTSCTIDDKHIDVFAMPDLAFLKFGGFVYLDQDKRIVGVKAMVASSFGSFRFKAVDWDAKVMIPSQDVDDSRYHKITIPTLYQHGARRFCWLTPKEFKPLGGFGYKMDDESFVGMAVDG